MTCKCSSSAAGGRIDKMASVKRIAVVAAVVLLLSMAVVGSVSAYTVTLPADTDNMHYTATADGQPYTSGTDVSEGTVVVINAVPQNNSYVVTYNGWRVSPDMKVKNWSERHNKLSFEVMTADVTITANVSSAFILQIPVADSTHHMTYTAMVDDTIVNNDEGVGYVASGERVIVTATYSTEGDTGYEVTGSGWSVKNKSGGSVSITGSHNYVRFLMSNNNVTVNSTEVSANKKLTYYANGADSGNVPVESSWYNEDDTVTVCTNTGLLMKADDNYFDGWTANVDVKDTSGNTITAGTVISAGAKIKMPEKNVTLSAHWTDSYIRVEYVNRGNGSYLNTGWYSGYDPKIEFGLKVTEKYDNSQYQIFGSRASGTYCIWTGQNGSSSIQEDYGENGSHVFWQTSISYFNFYSYSEISLSNVFMLNSVKTGNLLERRTFGGPVSLFGIDQSTGSVRYNLYYANMYTDGVIVRKYIPVETSDTSKCGLYDIVYGKYYNGSGYWKGNVAYSVVYKGNGNTGGAVPVDDLSYVADAAVTVKDQGTMVKEDCVFYGWIANVAVTKYDGSYTYAAGELIPAGTVIKMPGSSVVFTAVWGYKVTYDTNDGDGTAPVDSTWYVPGATVEVMDKTDSMSKGMDEFAGWTLNQDGSGDIYGPGQTFVITANTILYANWVTKGSPHYTVAYNANGGTGTMTDQEFTYDVAQNLSTNEFIKTGCVFSGWATEEHGSVVYSDEESVSNLTATQGDTVNLYAVWDTITYTFMIPAALTLDGSGSATTADYSITMTSTPASGDPRYITMSLTGSVNYDTTNNAFRVKNLYSENYQEYTIKNGDNTLVKRGDDIVSVYVDGTGGTSKTETLSYQLTGLTAYAGTYQDTLTFTVAVEKLQTLQLTGGTWKDKNSHVISSVDVQEGSTITVNGNTVTFAKEGYNTVVVTHENLATRNLYIRSSSDTERSVVSGTTTVLATDEKIHWGLPSGYTEVDYIESTGTQYIDTGFVSLLNEIIEIDFEYCSGNDTENRALLGVYGGSTSGYQLYGNNTSSFYFIQGYGYIEYTYPGTVRTVMVHDIENRTVTFNGVSGATTPEFPMFGAGKTWFLFSAKGMNDGREPSICKVYNLKITRSDTVILNFVPCIYHYGQADSAVGMYDTVSGAFFGNQATTGDDFIPGKTLTLEGSGIWSVGGSVVSTVDVALGSTISVDGNTVTFSYGGSVYTTLKYSGSLEGMQIGDDSTLRTAAGGAVLITDTRMKSVGQEDYTMLDYIESTGTQWIDTGVELTNNSDSEIVFLTPTNAIAGVYGSRDSSTSNNINVTVSSDNYLVIDFNSSDVHLYRASCDTIPVNIKLKAVTNKSLRALYNYDSGEVLSSNSVAVTDTITTPTNAYIFKVGGNPYSENIFTGKVYSCKISESGTLVRNFVPCKTSSGEVGMYDTVSGGFFENQGTGVFIPGKTLTLEGSGIWSVGGSVVSTVDVALGSTISVGDDTVTFSYGGSVYTTLKYSGSLTGVQIGDDSTLRTAAGGAVQVTDTRMKSVVQEDYTMLEYIESTGTQYIDTGVKLTNNSDSEVIFMSYDNTAAGIYGSRVSANDRNIAMGIGTESFLFADFNNSNYHTYRTATQTVYLNTKIKSVVNKNLRAFYNLDTGNTICSNATVNSEEIETSTNASLFYVTGFFNNNKIQGRVYSCKISELDGLVRNFVPCIRNSNGAVGMYDTVSGGFFGNQGTGTFIAGPVVNPDSDAITVTGITLNKSSTSISVSGTDELTATVSPTNATYPYVTWSSSDTAVAKVDGSGLVTGVAEGTATIKATANDGSGVSGSCTVTVYYLPAEYTHVEYIQSIDGKQTISTGFINSIGFKGECKVSEDVYPSGSDEFSDIMGTCGWLGDDPYRSYLSYHNDHIQFGYWTDCSEIYGYNVTVPHVFKIRTFNYDGYVEVDGVVKYENTTLNYGTGPATELNLFRNLKGKGYYYKIWDVSGNLVRDFIPVVYHYGEEDAEAGLYDLVTEEFYGNNSGVGSFTAGPVVS